jgi:hypothetical protein
MRGILLSEINDRKMLERIVGRSVCNRKGESIGVIWKIYISKREKRPLKVVVKTRANQKITISPERIRVERERIFLLDQTHEAVRAVTERLSEIVGELRSLRDTLFLLDEKYISSEISPEEYRLQRSSIEKRRLQLRLEASTLLETLNHLVENDSILDKDDERKIFEIIDSLALTFPVIHLKELEKLFKSKILSPQLMNQAQAT